MLQVGTQLSMAPEVLNGELGPHWDPTGTPRGPHKDPTRSQPHAFTFAGAQRRAVRRCGRLVGARRSPLRDENWNHAFFHKKQEQPVSVFQSGNYNPAKIFAVFFIVFFIFIFTKGIDVLTRTNSYETPYSGPETTTEERIKRFVK